MAGRLEGKIALVTGGAGGIGSATCRLFLREGARVALVDSNPEAAETVAAALRLEVPGSDIVALAADVGREADAFATIEAVLSRWGRLDVLVNNAGIREYLPLAEADLASWQRIIDVNLLGATFFIKACLPSLRKGGRASIVNISSTYGVHGRAGMGQYDATKAALLSVTRTLAFEEAAHGVRVNAICPGYILTPFHVARAAAAGRSAEELEGEDLPYCLMRRWADPLEIAYPILWLASDEASYFTGTALMADGGRPVV